MAIKPKSRAHEDRICKLECDLANLVSDFNFIRLIEIANEERAKRLRPPWYKRLNAYLSR